ncbi:hypothetical protein [Arthrobacter sp. EpRS71]|uniref:hypothetical protein n=1 Tax=Arthrobacter sp. EpRS71 TaxID=1743141 RepID=UPI000A84F189|nr:hypothetical protein [Arthrobacter sp. EpRS71]
MSSAAPFTPSRRDIQRYQRTVNTYKSVNEFLAASPVPGIVEIDGPQPIELLYLPAGGETTVVTFHAALSRELTPLPMFAGAKVTGDHGVNRIFVSDPGLYSGDDVRIAWFSGTAELPLQQILPGVLGHLIDSAGGRRTLFWGPSAGGFAALFYSKFFPGSTAVPINPQTDLSKFGYQNQRNYTRAAFAAETPEEHDSVFAHVICSDLRKHYSGRVDNFILYVQNSTDTHVEHHMRPFLDSLDSLARVRTITSHDWGVGHVAPPPDEIRGFLAALTDPACDWEKYFSLGSAVLL